MATVRLLCRPVLRVAATSASSSSSSSAASHSSSWMRDAKSNGDGKKSEATSLLLAGRSTKITGPEAAVQTPPLVSVTTNPVLDDLLPDLWSNVVDAWLSMARSSKLTPAQFQMLLEKGVVDCRFFTLLGVAGSLLGSVLCFVEGSFLVLKSYFKYFHALYLRSDMGCVVHLLIEAIDMFLVGTAMLIFGMGLYTMFVKSGTTKTSHPQLPQSTLFGLFSLKMMPSWIELQSLSQAKSRIGHAVMMILQVGIVEKFKSIPLVTGLDLACFAGSVVLSSASIFVLARLSASKLN